MKAVGVAQAPWILCLFSLTMYDGTMLDLHYAVSLRYDRIQCHALGRPLEMSVSAKRSSDGFNSQCEHCLDFGALQVRWFVVVRNVHSVQCVDTQTVDVDEQHLSMDFERARAIVAVRLKGSQQW
jgi:hypothetical protein